MIENAINGAIQQQNESAENGILKGSMSPLNNATLHEGQQETAGIPDDAEYFAYLHPPPKLVNHFGTYEHVMKNITNAEDKWWERPKNGDVNNNVLALFGGFVYFNESLSLI